MNKKRVLFLLVCVVFGFGYVVVWSAAGRQTLMQKLDQADKEVEGNVPYSNEEIKKILADIRTYRIQIMDPSKYTPLQNKLLREWTRRVLSRPSLEDLPETMSEDEIKKMLLFDKNDLPMFNDFSARIEIFFNQNPQSRPSAEEEQMAKTEKESLVTAINHDLIIGRAIIMKNFLKKEPKLFLKKDIDDRLNSLTMEDFLRKQPEFSLQQLLTKLKEFQKEPTEEFEKGASDDSFDWLISDIMTEISARPERLKHNMEALQEALKAAAAVIKVTQPFIASLQGKTEAELEKSKKTIALRTKSLSTRVSNLNKALQAVVE